MQFGIDVLSFFLKAATKKARLPKLNLVLGKISCCEIDDLSCLWVFEICWIPAKKDGYWVNRARYVRVDSFNLIR